MARISRVKEVVMASPEVSVLRMPTTVRERTKEQALTNRTANRDMRRPESARSERRGRWFSTSCTRSVELPMRSPTAVETSAAHSPARKSPPIRGLMWAAMVGRARVGFGRPGNCDAAMIPNREHRNPAGKISRAPRRNPLRAERSSRADRAIWTAACVEQAIVIMTAIQAARMAEPMPSTGSNQAFPSGRAFRMFSTPPKPRTPPQSAAKIPT